MKGEFCNVFRILRTSVHMMTSLVPVIIMIEAPAYMLHAGYNTSSCGLRQPQPRMFTQADHEATSSNWLVSGVGTCVDSSLCLIIYHG